MCASPPPPPPSRAPPQYTNQRRAKPDYGLREEILLPWYTEFANQYLALPYGATWAGQATRTCALAHAHTCALAHAHTCALAHAHTCALAHAHTCALAHAHTCALAHGHTCALAKAWHDVSVQAPMRAHPPRPNTQLSTAAFPPPPPPPPLYFSQATSPCCTRTSAPRTTTTRTGSTCAVPRRSGSGRPPATWQRGSTWRGTASWPPARPATEWTTTLGGTQPRKILERKILARRDGGGRVAGGGGGCKGRGVEVSG